MKPLMVRKVPVGEGRPKICAPLTGSTRRELEEEAELLAALPVDMAEWRVDAFAELFGEGGLIAGTGKAVPDTAMQSIADTAAMLRHTLNDLPLIFTVRTRAQGGGADISPAVYDELIRRAAALSPADLFDVELFTEGDNFSGTVEDLHSHGALVIGSDHDFAATPHKDGIISRLESMRAAGADICKIALMPGCMEDVLSLLGASLSMKEAHPETPLIAISMGKYGSVSRFAGEYFGSDITFASADNASAPGQIGVKDCLYILDLIHEELKT